MAPLIYLVILLCLLTGYCYGQDAPPLVLNIETTRYNIGANLQYLEDKDSDYDIEQITQPNLSKSFQVSDKKVFNVGFSASTFWFRLPFRVNSNSDEKIIRYLEINYRVLGNASLYQQLENGSIRRVNQGIGRAENQANPAFSSHLFPITINTNQDYHFFLRVNSASSIKVPIYYWHPQEFLRHETNKRIFYGIMYGIMLGLCLYNLSIFLSSRQKSYLYYSVYVLSMLGLISTINGIAIQYFWHQLPWLANQSTVILSAIQIYATTQFTRLFLRTSDNCKYEDKILNLSSFCAISSLALLAIDGTHHILVYLYSILCVIYAPTCLIAGFHCYLKKVKEARFYLLGWSFLIVAMITFLAGIYNLVPLNFFTEHAIEIGLVAEVLLFSFALADRINILQQSTQVLQQEKLSLANQSNRLKDEFLATISHEFRTPMNGIIGGLQIIKHYDLPDELHKHLDLVTDSSQKMINIVDNILTFSEAQSGLLDLNTTTFSHGALIEKITHIFQNQCATRNIQFDKYICAEADCIINADCNKIEQVLFQVFDNAVKFTAQGKISFSVSPLENSHANKIAFKYSIADTGVGIDTDGEGEIFDYFKQVDSSSTRRYGGLGIGLAISKALLNLMKGTISYQKNQPEGTIFTIEIAYELISEIRHPTQAAYNTIPRAEKKILIVEDNRVNQLIIDSTVKKLGFQTLLAENGKIAFELTQSEKPDLILMDCQMPEMDGYEATRAIRAGKDECRNVPIIAVTANATSNDRAKCFEAGMNDFIKKPVNKHELDERICHFIQHS